MLKYTGLDSDDRIIAAPLAPPAGMFAWWKADSESYANNDPVDTFNDRSGNGNHLIGTGAFRPIFKTSILNGLPVVRFSPLGTFLELSTPPAGVGGDTFTFYIIVGNATPAAFGMALSMQDAAPSFSEIRCTGDGLTWSAIGSDGIGSANDGAVNATFRVLGSDYDATGSSDCNIYLKDVVQNTFSDTGPFSPQNIGMGGRGGNPTSLNLACDIAEAICYDFILSSGSRTQLSNYLSAKYAL